VSFGVVIPPRGLTVTLQGDHDALDDEAARGGAWEGTGEDQEGDEDDGDDPVAGIFPATT
jgi:hypothetical protein